MGRFGSFAMIQAARDVIARQGVRFSSVRNIAMKSFQDGGRKLVAIEQNPAKDSKWARLAREGHNVVQIRDETNNKYVGVVVDGQLKTYPER